MDTALLVIDMQNGFVHPDGSCPRHGLVVERAELLTDEVAAFVSHARAADIPILYTQHQWRPGLLDMPAAFRRMFQTDPLVEGTWDAEILEQLRPTAEDAVIRKNRFDAFLYTDAELVLRALGVRRLLVAGVLTNVCVESSVRSAQQRDFEVIVASNCVASTDDDLHRGSLAGMGAIFAEVMEWRQALDRVTASEVPERTPSHSYV